MSALLTLLFVGCTAEPSLVLDLPEHIPAPPVPADNPLTAAKVELGRHLFYDTRLSVDGDMSCATCHQQELAFTDGEAQAVGTTGEVHPRGSMSLTNVAYSSRLAWANPLLDRLEHQALLPLFGDAPVEMGLADREDALVQTLADEPVYIDGFAAAFPDADPPISVEHLAYALASFERTLLSFDSPYDRFVLGDADALNASEKRGMELFFSERLECFHCHGGFNFSDSVDHDGAPGAEVAFHNTGLYDIDGAGSYPPPNTGIHAVTGKDADMGRFKAPTLRNVGVTAPYMHDGSIATLEEVVDHYSLGGRAESTDPRKSEFVVGFVVSDEERADVVAFLNALTDPGFLSNPALSNPWEER